MTARALPRLLVETPRVHVGPLAKRALSGEKGVLLGARRVRWVDVLDVEIHGELPLGRLVELRFERHETWDALGLSLSSGQFRRSRARLLRELVPGDVLLTEDGASVHLGDTWKTARIVRG